jgi:hypothetical protein
MYESKVVDTFLSHKILAYIFWTLHLYAYIFRVSIKIVLEVLFLFRPRCYILTHRHVSHFVPNFENLLST